MHVASIMHSTDDMDALHIRNIMDHPLPAAKVR